MSNLSTESAEGICAEKSRGTIAAFSQLRVEIYINRKGAETQRVVKTQY